MGKVTEMKVRRYEDWLERRKNLLQQCKEYVEATTGLKDWDPIVLMSVISAQAYTGYPAVDAKGQPVLDPETGEQVFVPPDYKLALQAATRVAPFLHQSLKPAEADTKKEAENQKDIHERIESTLTALKIKKGSEE